MGIKIVLTALPFFNHVYTPPLQLAYLKAYLRHHSDIETKIFDAESYYYRRTDNNSDLYWEKIWNWDRVLNKENKQIINEIVHMILSEGPEIVGFSVNRPNYIFTRQVSQELKRINPDIYIVYGGLHFCFRNEWRRYIAELHRDLPEVDCIVKNEGEATLADLAEIIKKKIRPTFCLGTTLRKGNEIIDCGDRFLIEDIDTVPFPDLSDYKKEDYLSDYIRILFFRGCVGRCVFCVENYTMGTIRMRSAGNIVDEIKLRIDQGFRKFQSCDLSLNPSTPRLEEILRLIISERLKIEFIYGQFRHSSSLTKKTFGLLREAGFRTIYFGTESGSQEILNRMSKDVGVETIVKNIRDAHDEGLKVVLFFMVGFPGETETTFSETIKLIRDNAKYISAVQHISPVNINWGTCIHEDLEAYNLDISTLFKETDIWQTKDGKNTYQWRCELAQRVRNCLCELGIPMVSFLKDGNATIPDIKKREISYETTKAANSALLSELIKEGRKYLADFNILDRGIDISDNNGLRYIIEVTNIGSATWRRHSDYEWIRVGCKIYGESQNSSLYVAELRQELPKDIASGEKIKIDFTIENRYIAKDTKYRIKFDMVNEHKFWFEDLGSLPLIDIFSCRFA